MRCNVHKASFMCTVNLDTARRGDDSGIVRVKKLAQKLSSNVGVIYFAFQHICNKINI